MLLRAGVPILQALDIVIETVNNRVMARAVEDVQASVREGESIAKPLTRYEIFPSMVVQMIAVGEETGQVDVMLAVIAALQEQIEMVESELRRFARADQRCRALETIFGVGPILACHLLAEIGDARRFQRPRQLVRASGLDPSVIESAESKRRGRLAKQGSRHLRWALVEAANHSHRQTSPDHDLYKRTVLRCGRGRARLTVARKIARRSYHVLLAAEAP
jgi:transposase